jgi:hypothetical protein
MNKYPGAPRPTWQRCPPHTPLKLVRVSGGCVAECLRCGKRGPKRESPVAARAAFFEAAD